MWTKSHQRNSGPALKVQRLMPKRVHILYWSILILTNNHNHENTDYMLSSWNVSACQVWMAAFFNSFIKRSTGITFQTCQVKFSKYHHLYCCVYMGKVDFFIGVLISDLFFIWLVYFFVKNGWTTDGNRYSTFNYLNIYPF